MNRHSTLNSWLEKLVWVLTGNFAKAGTQYMTTSLVSLIRNDGPRADEKRSPVTGSRQSAGLSSSGASASAGGRSSRLISPPTRS